MENQERPAEAPEVLFKITPRGEYVSIMVMIGMAGVEIRLNICSQTEDLAAFLSGDSALEDDDGTVNGMVTTLSVEDEHVTYRVESKEGGIDPVRIRMKKDMPAVADALVCLGQIARGTTQVAAPVLKTLSLSNEI